MYNVKIIESSKELTKREVLKMKDTTNTLSIDELIKDGEDTSFIITPVDYVVLSIECDKFDGEEKTVKNIIIIDKDDKKYRTGSQSFIEAFTNIYDEMRGEEEYEIEIYKVPSKNYKSKYFITCSII